MRFPRRRATWAALALALGLGAAPAAAQLQLPAPVGYVNDFAHVIDAAHRDSMLAVIDEVRAKSGGEIVVVTLPSLEGRDASEVARQIGREWKVGAKGGPNDPNRNTGTIVLLSVQDRAYRIETGTRTMTFITAAETGRIARDLMIPEFRAGNMGRGLYLGVAALGQDYAGQYGFALSPTIQVPDAPPAQVQRDGRRQRGGGSWIPIALFILVLVLSRGRIGWLPLLLMSGGGNDRRGGGGWGGGGGFGGGGGGGGFGGFGGGGGFSGGGSGGNW